jgi:hypothetical protein
MAPSFERHRMPALKAAAPMRALLLHLDTRDILSALAQLPLPDHTRIARRQESLDITRTLLHALLFSSPWARRNFG